MASVMNIAGALGAITGPLYVKRLSQLIRQCRRSNDADIAALRLAQLLRMCF